MKGKKNYLVYTVLHVNGTGAKNFTWNRFVFVFIFMSFTYGGARIHSQSSLKNGMFFSRSLFRSFKFWSCDGKAIRIAYVQSQCGNFQKDCQAFHLNARKSTLNADFESSFIRERTATNQCKSYRIWSVHFLRTFYWKPLIPISGRSFQKSFLFDFIERIKLKNIHRKKCFFPHFFGISSIRFASCNDCKRNNPSTFTGGY